MMAILGVLFAVVYMAVFYGGTAISVALTPLGPIMYSCIFSSYALTFA